MSSDSSPTVQALQARERRLTEALKWALNYVHRELRGHHIHKWDKFETCESPQCVKLREVAALVEETAPAICMFCNGCGWCEGSPAFTCPKCKGEGTARPSESDS